jgi:hypothetical protein
MAQVVNPQIAETGSFSNTLPDVMDPAHRSTMDGTGNHVGGILSRFSRRAREAFEQVFKASR